MTIFCFLKLAFIKILSASPNGDYRLTLTVALPDGIFYAEDSTLYWMVRSINDTGISIDENGRNSVMHGRIHPRFWTKESFEQLIHDIAVLSKYSRF